MRCHLLKASLVVLVSVLVALSTKIPLVWASEMFSRPGEDVAQQPTVAIPTVTGTPTGPIAIVYSDPDEQINVRSGPGTDYPKVGVLLNRQQVPALGATPGGSWVQIIYPGVDSGVAWVYAPLVRIEGVLPIVEPPPTPTLMVTPTIDPTLASQFVVDIPATRLPTYPPPPPLVIATYPAEEIGTGTGGVPIGFVITGLTVVGVFGLIISLLRRR
ncbi:MAG: SH3 domain-containing protein [Anaerolineales bacterium]|nr:SH3 domain-containing protein [Anaerolineales bacterium]